MVSSFRSADIAVFHDFVPPPYGGGNQFLWGLRRELERRAWRVEANTISPVTRACLYNSFNFDADRLTAIRRPGCRMVHRVDGPISAYRGSDADLDQRIWRLNADLADATVIQSEYSRRAHEAMGLQFKSPAIIRNAADPTVFHARDRAPYLTGPKVRVIATSWSTNPNKGADIYAWLDRHLDSSRYEVTFLGRSPVAFSRIRLIPAAPSADVARELRTQDVFLIASRNEPCSNALIEAMSCGLPVAYLDSGSHGEVVGGGGLPFRSAEDVPEVLDRLVADHATYVSRLQPPDLLQVADQYLTVMGLPPVPTRA